MPNCSESIALKRLEFGRLGRRVIEGRFDGGNMTSDGGVMLLAALDRRLGLIDAAADCLADPRDRPLSYTVCATCCASVCMDWYKAGKT